MASRQIRLFLATLLFSTLSGCGTLVSFEKGALDNPKIYGGVQFDTEMVRTINADEKFAKSLGMLYAADIPLSFMADTLTLPITVTTTLINATRDDKK